jgi:hypothetical protein
MHGVSASVFALILLVSLLFYVGVSSDVAAFAGISTLSGITAVAGIYAVIGIPGLLADVPACFSGVTAFASIPCYCWHPC